MKATLSPARPPEFQPVVLTITLESAGEVQALYDISNNSASIGHDLIQGNGVINRRYVNDVLHHIYIALNNRFGNIGTNNRIA
jgi:hypothetical protein